MLAVLGVVIFAVGLALMLAAALPVRMSIERRATLSTAGIPVTLAGLVMFAEGVAPVSRPGEFLICCFAPTLAGAVFLRWLFIRNMKAYRGQWEERLRSRTIPVPMEGLIKVYLDID